MIATKPTIAELKKFGFTFCVIFLALTGWVYFRHHSLNIYLLILSALFLLTSLISPRLLKPLQVGWMAFAYGLSWINTRLILGVVFFAVFTPIGLLLRLMGKDILNERLERSASSYWIKRESTTVDKQRYEQMF